MTCNRNKENVDSLNQYPNAKKKKIMREAELKNLVSTKFKICRLCMYLQFLPMRIYFQPRILHFRISFSYLFIMLYRICLYDVQYRVYILKT